MGIDIAIVGGRGKEKAGGEGNTDSGSCCLAASWHSAHVRSLSDSLLMLPALRALRGRARRVRERDRDRDVAVVEADATPS